MLDRILGWLVCGPLGHFVAGAIDWGVLVVRYCFDRMRGREPFSS